MKTEQAIAVLQKLLARRTNKGQKRNGRHSSAYAPSSKEWYEEEADLAGGWEEPWKDNVKSPDVIKQYQHDVATLRRARSCSLQRSEERQRRSQEFLVEQLMAEHLWTSCRNDPSKTFLKQRLVNCGITDRYHLK